MIEDPVTVVIVLDRELSITVEKSSPVTVLVASEALSVVLISVEIVVRLLSVAMLVEAPTALNVILGAGLSVRLVDVSLVPVLVTVSKVLRLLDVSLALILNTTAEVLVDVLSSITLVRDSKPTTLVVSALLNAVLGSVELADMPPLVAATNDVLSLESSVMLEDMALLMLIVSGVLEGVADTRISVEVVTALAIVLVVNTGVKLEILLLLVLCTASEILKVVVDAVELLAVSVVDLSVITVALGTGLTIVLISLVLTEMATEMTVVVGTGIIFELVVTPASVLVIVPGTVMTEVDEGLSDTLDGVSLVVMLNTI